MQGAREVSAPLAFYCTAVRVWPSQWWVRLCVPQFSYGSWCAKALLLAREDAPCFEHPFLAGARKFADGAEGSCESIKAMGVTAGKVSNRIIIIYFAI